VGSNVRFSAAELFDYIAGPNAQRGRTTKAQQTPEVFHMWLRSVDNVSGGAARACPRLRQNGLPLKRAAEIDAQYHHQAVHSDAAARSAVAMFRSPFERALSHWRYVPGSRHGACPTRDELYLLRDFSLKGGIVGCMAGCQCKMVLGRNCLACRNRTTHQENSALMRGNSVLTEALQPPLSNVDIAECVRRVKLFRFAGLTEHWNDSIALFCEQQACPSWVLDPARRVSRRGGISTRTCVPPTGWRDEADTAVYEAARGKLEGVLNATVFARRVSRELI
jgi:hypothetical protein